MKSEVYRVELAFNSAIPDSPAQKVITDLTYSGFDKVNNIKTSQIYLIHTEELSREQVHCFVKDALIDPVLNSFTIDEKSLSCPGFHWYVEIGFKPGVTDNSGKTAKENLELFLGKKLPASEKIFSKKGFYFDTPYTLEEMKDLIHEHLMNELIESCNIINISSHDKYPNTLWSIPVVKLEESVEIVNFDFKNTQEINNLSFERTLALSEDEAKVIFDYFNKEEIIEDRKQQGLSKGITDVELEMIAQTWSEHCKHKIFNAHIRYSEEESPGIPTEIQSIYKTYIKSSTAKIRENMGADDWCVSVFSDNAGVIKFNEDWNLTLKVETHNSPSALDPYGGALTGIVGVNRDSFGTGIGAQLVANTNVFCFASPFYEKNIPPNLKSPKRIFEGVRRGVEHGGNKSGIPTVNGSIVFDDRFLGKPLVFCGTAGIMPSKINEKETHIKKVTPGSLIVMTGGRVGKDGIHGATFSSEALNENSPATAVQIGDPIIQKKMFDFLLQARDQELYECITDNGAGGLSSSVGEMAQFTNGCEIYLDRVPLKYSGLQPWEILISESQERMTLAVPPEKVDQFLKLSEMFHVESTVLGTFNNSGYFKAYFDEQLVAYLSMDFVHNGLPPMKLTAHWVEPKFNQPKLPQNLDYNSIIHQLLQQLNICSKESVIRQYDHEVQGGSVIKPLVGEESDGPADAAVVRPLLDSYEGIAISNGIYPRYSDHDTYHMTACVIDEAIRNIIAVGGSLKQIAGLDNYCWCDPISSEKNLDGSYKLAQLVRSGKALYDYTIAFGVPCVSGKDSMKNDYTHGNQKISIPPTLLFSAFGKIDDIRKTMTSDVKKPGDHVYIIGNTYDELGGSELFNMLNLDGGHVPKVDAETAKKKYEKVHQAINNNLLNSCHDCSDGGMIISLIESSFSGGFGMKVDLTKLSTELDLSLIKLLFSESQSRFIVTVPDEKKLEFEKHFNSCECFNIGIVSDENDFVLTYNNDVIVNEDIYAFKKSWQKPLLSF